MIKYRPVLNSCILALGLTAASYSLAAPLSFLPLFFDQNVELSGDLNFSLVADPIGPGIWVTPDWAPLSGLPQFDPALGTLTGATLVIDGDLEYEIEVEGTMVLDDNQPNGAEVFLELGVGIGVPLAGGETLEALNMQPASASCGYGPQEGPCFDFGYDLLYVYSDAYFTGADLAAFVGTGTLENLAIYYLIGQTGSSLDNLDDANVWLNSFIDPSFIGTVSVEYEFSEVPLPAAAWLFGTALIGLAGIARRQKAV